MELGYALSSEEFGPRQLVANARRAERAGFGFALVSDHFHPWLDEQGESPFVWSTIGAVSQATESLVVGTGVTCPLIRIHPAVVAQAAATSAALMPGRFFLGVGTGENLNEHILGDRWPSHEERIEMLEEAVAIMRELWMGGQVTHRGAHYSVDRARLYTLPDDPPPVAVAAAGPIAAALAGRIGDALITTAPDERLVAAFEESGGAAKPRYGQLTVCYAATEQEAVDTAVRCWPNGALGGDLGQELVLPRHFRQASELLSTGDVAEKVVCTSEPGLIREAIEEFASAGFDRVYIHQVGPEQEPFIDLCARELLSTVESAQ